jgi:hypothetical protein
MPFSGEVLICFDNVSSAIMAEKVLAEGKFQVKVMPVPGSIRKGCGFCLRLPPEEREAAALLLQEKSFSGIESYLRQETGGTISYAKIDGTA